MSKVNVDRYQGYDVCTGTLHGNRCSASIKNASPPDATQHKINKLRNQAKLSNRQCAILQTPLDEIGEMP